MANLKYRADLDGVRAVAVVSVILAHAGVPGVSGGFLGVDVFFVISGYLITTILKNELDQDRFSILRFYERRIRRILPALLLVIACCVPFALWLMLPDFLQKFGQSVVATLFFANNLLLMLTSGYWELESSFKPLLHTWSLGVEEQFYIAFPLFLALLARFGKRSQLAGIVVVGLLSFAFSEYGWRTFPAQSFYLPMSRAWELMVGCAIAYVPYRETRFANVLSFAALIALLAPMAIFDKTTPSPSYLSAIPVLGTSGIILFSRPGTIACRLLSLRPVVFIGLISYSAYLWHQPIFAFARVASFDAPGPLEMAGLTVLTFVLSVLSWRFVEEPFRNRRAMSIKKALTILLPVAALLTAFGLLVHVTDGFPRWTFPRMGAGGSIYIGYNERIRQFSTPEFPANGKSNVLVLGDSFARDAANVMLESGALAGKNLMYREGYPVCPDRSGIFSDLNAARAASVVVIALHLQGPACARQMEAAVAKYTRVPVIFFGAKSFGENVNPFGRVRQDQRSGALATVPREVRATNDALAAQLPAGSYIDQLRLLGEDGARIHFFDADGNPLSPDRRHLTRYGARFVAQRLLDRRPPAFVTIVRAPPPAPGADSSAQ